jgi:hypothetical protein
MRVKGIAISSVSVSVSGEGGSAFRAMSLRGSQLVMR